MYNHPKAFVHIPQLKMVKSPEEWVAIAEGLAKAHKGVLPCRKWLHKHGYFGLDSRMQKNPKDFAHIPQKRKTKTVEEWVNISEVLAKKNNGILHNIRRLRDTGYNSLAHYMNRHPEAFSHIKQSRLDTHGKEK